MGLKELTEQYVSSFNNKDLKHIETMLCGDGCTLVDPENVFSGKNAVLNEVSRIFQFNTLKFVAQNIYTLETENTSVIEFDIQLDDLYLQGIDIIEWQDNKIFAIRAYVNEAKDKEIRFV
jgi:hypothetical protein